MIKEWRIKEDNSNEKSLVKRLLFSRGIKTEQEIVLMRKACEITRDTLLMLEKNIKPGVTTKELDKLAYDFIKKNNAKPGFLHYGGFPASICASVNNEVVHGIPSDRVLKEGDIISIDVGAKYKGYNGDSARTFPVGKISDEKQKLPQEVIDFYQNKGIYEQITSTDKKEKTFALVDEILKNI